MSVTLPSQQSTPLVPSETGLRSTAGREGQIPREGGLLDEPVSLWWADLDGPRSAGQERWACLSPAERRRAECFVRPLDRARFVVARGSLRRMLASQLGCAPGAVPIVIDERGKPGLEDCGLRFSASSSAGLALYATSWSMDLGVDVEEIRDDVEVDRIGARFFTVAERRVLASLPASQRLAGGFRCWTRKEAYAKGIGDGLTFPLDTTHVGVGGRSELPTGWSIHQLELAPGFAAALAGSEVCGWIPSAPRRIT